MDKGRPYRIWFLETRPQFLLLSIILVIYGSAIALHQGYFNSFYFVLTLLGLISAHIAVNVLNDYFDYKSSLDLHTVKTPFSGGSGILPAKYLNPENVYKFGLLFLFIGLVIGIYLVIARGIILFPLILVGALFVYFYTTHLTKLMLGEIAAGLGLGCLPVIGSYFVQTGFYSLDCIIASIPAGILTHNLLLLNEVPDYEADKRFGRRNFVTVFGKDKAVKLYSFLTLLVYVIILICVVTGIVPVLAAISILTLPIAIEGIRISKKYYNDINGLIPALANNVKVVLGTQFLLALGFLFDVII